MPDENIRTLFNEVGDLKVQLTRVETLLVETVIANQKANNERLDRHSKKIDTAFERITTLENDKKSVVSIKNLLIGAIGLTATITGIVATIIHLIN